MISKSRDATFLPLTRNRGLLRKKHQLRAVFRSLSLILLVAGYSAFNLLTKERSNISAQSNKTKSTKQQDRRNLIENSDELLSYPLLARQKVPIFRRVAGTSNATTSTNGDSASTTPDNSDSDECEEGKANPRWMLAVYVIGVIYMFIALAVVVDEFFVPALEEMSSENHLNLSMDVAGATLMAAGGSAPELFTSFFGTFAKSDVGFGTIVGSAVFNVLFVIAMCSMLSKEVLMLTWWPLFRDCIYYVISLLVLALFVGWNSQGQIYAWEAAVLFVMYFGYVLVMKFNQQLYHKLTGNKLKVELQESDMIKERSELYFSGLNESSSSKSLLNPREIRDFRWQGTFRAGVLKLLRDPNNFVENGGVGIVSQIAGDVAETWKTVDKNRDGEVSREELSSLFIELECPLSDEQVDAVLKQLDEDNDGKVSEQEFTKWYIKSEERVRSRIQNIFEEFDTNNSGTIERDEVKNLLLTLEPTVTDDDVQKALEEMNQEGSEEEISYKEFSDWYLKSILFERQAHKVEVAVNGITGIFENFKPPEHGGIGPTISWLVVLPLIVTLSFTVPDVRRPKMAKGYWCYLAFIMAIGWVGVYSKYMVEWTEIIGKTIGIPNVVMGLTFLAAGTSVPDLLSSVIVARRGEGDMAVSSSIGSNIFDILVGLPLPWLIFTLATTDDYVTIGSSGVTYSVLILIGMIVAIVLTIHFSGWMLTKKVAYAMFLLYFAFLAVSIYLELPLKSC